MRTLLGMAVGVALAAAGSAPAQTGGVYLDVKRLSTSKDSNARTQMHYYSDKDVNRTVSLGITVKNMSQQEGRVTVEWFFIAKTLNGNLRWIYDKGSDALTMAKTSHTNLVANSKELQATVTESYAYRSQTGSKPDGYIVRAKMADKVIAVSASSRPLEQAARDEKQIQGMLDAAERGNRDQPQPPAAARPAGAANPANAGEAAPGVVPSGEAARIPRRL